jgi:hypothetical protein
MSNVYQDPAWALMTPQQIEDLAASLDDTSATEIYTARYEAHFLKKGLPAAEAKTRAKWWAEIPDHVWDPDLSVDDYMMQHRLAQGTLDPASITIGKPGAQPPSRTSSLTLTAPTVRMEQPNLIGKRFAINAFAISPAREYWAQASPGADFLDTAEPQLFNAGPLPRFTASGLDPSILAQCHWSLRHSAAYAESKADVLEMVEASAVDRMDYEQDLDYAQLQNSRGRDHLGDYLARAHAWALGTAAEPVSDADIDEAWDELGGYPGAPRQLPNTKR